MPVAPAAVLPRLLTYCCGMSRPRAGPQLARSLRLVHPHPHPRPRPSASTSTSSVATEAQVHEVTEIDAGQAGCGWGLCVIVLLLLHHQSAAENYAIIADDNAAAAGARRGGDASVH